MLNLSKRNKYNFGLGTIGRDMFYSLISMYLVWYLTEILNLSDKVFAWVGGTLTVLRIFDALNDPFMGVIVDNTRSKWGKFKPWILFGAISCAIFLVMLFADLGLSPTAYIICFIIFYLSWDITYGLNDIAYWSMLPALSLDQKEREKIGAFARICANIGLFAVVVGILPVTNAMGAAMGGNPPPPPPPPEAGMVRICTHYFSFNDRLPALYSHWREGVPE